MATIGQWSGGSVSILPSTSWTAPNGMFPTQDRNDSSAYSFNSSTSTLTLPSSDLADAYLVIAGFEFTDTSNGRFNPAGRFVQASGTGNFVSGTTSGYSRDASEDTSWVRTFAVIHNPSASATIQFQWKTDDDLPTGGTTLSALQVIPIYGDAFGLYSSTSTTMNDSTTPTAITGFTAVHESDTSSIELTGGNTVTLKTDSKKYLVLGSQYGEGAANTRTQRWHGLSVDGTLENDTRGYSYSRDGDNDNCGEMFSTIVSRSSTDIDLQSMCFRGEPLTGFPQTGADAGGGSTASNPSHTLAIIELPSSAEVFRSYSGTQQSLSSAGTRVAIEAVNVLDFNDSTFTKVNNAEVDVGATTDVLLGANLSGGYASSTTQRFTGYAQFEINGTEDDASRNGNYGRGNQGSADTWGWSANLLSAHSVSSGQEVGVRAGKITGGENGTVAVLSGWTGFWGLDLDSIEPSSGTTYNVSATINVDHVTAVTPEKDGFIVFRGYAGSLNNGADTLSNVDIGPADSNRVVILTLGGDGNSPVSSLTIGGVTATRVANQDLSSSYAHVWIAKVPTGTTADIVVSPTDSSTDLGIFTYTVNTTDSISTIDTNAVVATDGDNSPLDLSLIAPSNSEMVAVAFDDNSVDDEIRIEGMDRRDGRLDANSNEWITSYSSTNVSGSQTITATGNVIMVGAAVAFQFSTNVTEEATTVINQAVSFVGNAVRRFLRSATVSQESALVGSATRRRLRVTEINQPSEVVAVSERFRSRVAEVNQGNLFQALATRLRSRSAEVDQDSGLIASATRRLLGTTIVNTSNTIVVDSTRRRVGFTEVNQGANLTADAVRALAAVVDVSQGVTLIVTPEGVVPARTAIINQGTSLEVLARKITNNNVEINQGATLQGLGTLILNANTVINQGGELNVVATLINNRMVLIDQSVDVQAIGGRLTEAEASIDSTNNLVVLPVFITNGTVEIDQGVDLSALASAFKGRLIEIDQGSALDISSVKEAVDNIFVQSVSNIRATPEVIKAPKQRAKVKNKPFIFYRKSL